MPSYTGQNVVDFVLLIVGQFFIAVLAIRAFAHWAKAEWGAMLGFLLSGIPVAIAVYKPDWMVAFFTKMGELFFTTGA